MSGGSFNYLCFKEGSDLFASTADLKMMVLTLEQWVPNSHALHDAQKLLIDIREMTRRLDQMPDSPLGKIFQAVEWAVSGDYSQDQALEVIHEYERHD